MLTIHHLLNALSKRLQSGPLSMSNDYQCHAQVDGSELNIEWLDNGGSLFVYVPVGPLSATRDAQLLEDLMEANLLFQGTADNALFGFDKEQEEVFLFQSFNMDTMQEGHFVSACESMIDRAKTWKYKLLAKMAPPSYVGSLAASSYYRNEC